MFKILVRIIYIFSLSPNLFHTSPAENLWIKGEQWLNGSYIRTPRKILVKTTLSLRPFLLIPLIVPVGKGCEMTLNQVFRSMAHAIPAIFDIIVLDHKIKPSLFGLWPNLVQTYPQNCYKGKGCTVTLIQFLCGKIKVIADPSKKILSRPNVFLFVLSAWYYTNMI